MTDPTVMRVTPTAVFPFFGLSTLSPYRRIGGVLGAWDAIVPPTWVDGYATPGGR